MTLSKTLLATCLAAFSLAGAAAAEPPDFSRPPEFFAEGDLPLENGSVIKDFSIGYVTYGRLNAARSNAILMVTAISGNHHRLDFLIGPGKALDSDRYFIITTDAIGNGVTTSPSNSKSQPGMAFPHFLIRDMVDSQYRLVTQKLGITHLFAVIGASMGGMQTLQWGVSHPDMMDALVPIVPLGRTPAWTKGVLELTRQEIMSDPAWQDGKYVQAPEAGMRLWAGTMALITRTPDLLKVSMPESDAVRPWLRQTEDDAWKAFDARNWVYQSWAYDAHDLGATPGFGGDYAKALGAIRARTLVLAGVGDLLNPEPEARDVAEHIPGAEFQSIEPRGPAGHFSAAGKSQPEIDFQNKAIAGFLSGIAAQRHID
jgi:homoserine O-acetyltransferase/O-succinyltransferase